jgi:putative hydrolase of the HAD superfamily
MKLKGVLLDIDNTLYEYNKPHEIALATCLESISEILKLDMVELNLLYLKAKKQIHIQLPCTASSHNRLLYFQRMFEIAGCNQLGVPLDLFRKYWKIFNQNILLYKGVDIFLEKIKQYKVCLLTDLTSDVQFEKIHKLNLFNYADYIVTSEEAGIEKPHPYMFLLALNKMSLTNKEVCMVGDNYQKDIIGASNLNIKSYWLNKSNEIHNHINKGIIEFDDFNTLIDLF